MSMQYYPLEDYGLFLDEQTTIELASKIAEKENREPFNDNDVYEATEFLDAECGSNIIGGYKYPICDCGVDYSFGEPIDEYIILPCAKYPRLFSTCYASLEEIVQEFVEQTYGFLSEEYIRKNLCKVTGVELG